MIKREEIVEELYEILNYLNGIPECRGTIGTDLVTTKEKVKGLIWKLSSPN